MQLFYVWAQSTKIQIIPKKCQSPPNRLRSAQQTAINATLERLVNSLKTDFGALGDRL
jgi:hypothetical protein